MAIKIVRGRIGDSGYLFLIVCNCLTRPLITLIPPPYPLCASNFGFVPGPLLNEQLPVHKMPYKERRDLTVLLSGMFVFLQPGFCYVCGNWGVPVLLNLDHYRNGKYK